MNTETECPPVSQATPVVVRTTPAESDEESTIALLTTSDSSLTDTDDRPPWLTPYGIDLGMEISLG
ncbi:signal peptidase complex catalytic subunit SEC11A, putative [Anopheles sinensis]|uniref:Signal peptidase complex catalytic subunit SEC11A, putative n=1 Tax=Anopheles sinensis TaxID=74873 RepID=A0A084VH28_ANOSI|nr:signal peptidase complex catalytic subunit SEC11A, putative [Anopheles sinensis]